MDKFFYSRELAPISVLAYVKNNSSISFNKREDLYGKTFCKEEGYYRHDIEDLLENGNAKLVTVPDKKVVQCFEKLESGEVDIVSLGELVADGLLSKYDYKDKFRPLDRELHKDTLHLIFSKNNEYACRNLRIMYAFNQAVLDMKNDGTLDNIQRKHFRWHRKLNE
jgi:polar amino acid transport system substrate-binding protein